MTTPTSPQKRTRSRKAQPKVEVAENTLSKMEGQEDAPTLKVETAQPDPDAKPNQVLPSMKPQGNYAQKPRVGTPTLGRSPNYVTKVGLGKLKVTHAHGTTDV
jgi:hypothetical protein